MGKYGARMVPARNGINSVVPRDKFGNIVYIHPKDKYGNNKSFIMHTEGGFVPIKDGNWDTTD